MIDLSPDLLDQVASPPLSPSEHAIDRDHLYRMTLGERRLECEVLALFDRQADLLIGRIRSDDPDVAAAAAHTLKGSAQSIGAWQVVRAAEAIETAAAEEACLQDGVAALEAALRDVRAAIAEFMRAH